MDDLRQAILYGCLPVDIRFSEWNDQQQYEIVRYIVANPRSVERLRIQDSPNNWIAMLLRYIAPSLTTVRESKTSTPAC